MYAATDVARQLEILDGAAVNAIEESLRPRAADIGGNGVVAAVEGAAETVARHRRDADVGGQLHVLAAVVIADTDIVDKVVPVVRAADDVGTGLRETADAGGSGVVVLAAEQQAVLVFGLLNTKL